MSNPFEKPIVHAGETPEEAAARLSGDLELAPLTNESTTSNPPIEVPAMSVQQDHVPAAEKSLNGDHNQHVVEEIIHRQTGGLKGTAFAIRLYALQQELEAMQPVPNVCFMREEALRHIESMLDGYGQPSYLGRITALDTEMFGIAPEELSDLIAKKGEAYLNRNILNCTENGASPHELRERYKLKPLEYKEGIKAVAEAVRRMGKEIDSHPEEYDYGDYIGRLRTSFKALRKGDVIRASSLNEYAEPDLHAALLEFLKKTYAQYLARIEKRYHPFTGEPEVNYRHTGEKPSEAQYIQEVLRTF